MNTHCWCVTCHNRTDTDDLTGHPLKAEMTEWLLDDALGSFFLGLFQVFLKVFGQSAGG